MAPGGGHGYYDSSSPAGSYASPSSDSTSPSSTAPSPYASLDGYAFTFPSEHAENCKLLFPTAELHTTITQARYYSRIHAQLFHALWPVLADMISFYPGISDTFCQSHRNIILLYDLDAAEHEKHYRLVLQMLQSQRIPWDNAKCVYARPTPREVGFVFGKAIEQRTPGLVMVDVGDGGTGYG